MTWFEYDQCRQNARRQGQSPNDVTSPAFLQPKPNQASMRTRRRWFEIPMVQVLCTSPIIAVLACYSNMTVLHTHSIMILDGTLMTSVVESSGNYSIILQYLVTNNRI